MVNVKIKKLNPNAIIPTKGSKDAAAYDLYACITDQTFIPWEGGGEKRGVKIMPHTTVKIGTGISTEIPVGYWGAILARSGLSTKQGLRPANCLGCVDADYRGEWIVALHNDSSEVQIVENGERIAQMMILPALDTALEEVDELGVTDRGEGGFGSSGKF